MSELTDRLRHLLGGALHAADAHTIGVIYDRVSVDPARVRARLARHGLQAATRARVPRIESLDRSADWVIAQGRGSAGALGGFAGLGGWMSIPPELAAFLVTSVRMVQRIGVVYGFDPSTDRGRMAFAQALAAGFEVELPPQGQVAPRVSDVARMMAGTVPSSSTELTTRMGGRLATSVLARSLRIVTGRLGRLVPLVSSGVSAWDNAGRSVEIGRRAKAVYRQLADVPLPDDAPVEDAIEVV